MRKMIIALAALAISLPAAAQNVPQALAQLDAAVASVKAAVAAQTPPAAAPPPSTTLPDIASYQVITARVGVQRMTYVGNLPGGCPCTWSQPKRGRLTGASPSPIYVAISAGQDTFTVRTADGAMHGYFTSVYP